MKIEELKKFYIKQMERIEGAKARKFTPETYESWWADGVKKYGYTAQDIERAATALCESSDAFPILSTFIYHCGSARKKRREKERLVERHQEEGARDLTMTGILERGVLEPRSKKAQAVIDNTLDFLRGKIKRKVWAKRQSEIEKGE